jgi:hypothetical protein
VSEEPPRVKNVKSSKRPQISNPILITGRKRDQIRFGQARGRHSQRIISTVERPTSDGRYTLENGRYTPQSELIAALR